MPFPLRAATLNLRNPCDPPPHDWDSRRPLVAELVRRWRPDVLGTQEGFYHQVLGLAEDTGYDWIGLGRDGGSRGEFMAIFFRRDRFEPVAFDHFWLSDEPDRVGSSTWGNSNVRMATWVLLRERELGRTLFVLNTHLDHQVPAARLGGARLIGERIAGLNPAVPLILTGDFNAAAGTSDAYRALLEAGLSDTWTLAAEAGPDGRSYHSWGNQPADGPRIDWILLRGVATVQRAWMDRDRYAGAWPSDHFAVLADLVLG